MNRKTLSQVKNLARRALDDLTDPPPSDIEQQRLRDHFAARCCYCGAEAIRRAAHVDHAERDGGNGLGNLLLACSKCNGDQKREMGWRDFLRFKCGDDHVAFEQRRARISDWLNTNARPSMPVGAARLLVGE